MKLALQMAALAACCYDISAQSLIDKYLTDPLVYTTVGSSANGLSQPRDLDFKPFTKELWVLNYGNSAGGTSVIFYNAGQSNQTWQYRKDSHSDHFMMYPSAIAFGDNGEWANTNEIKSTAGPSSTFMGPALWSGDTAIYARVFQNNWLVGFPLGSHLDMLHQSPFSMGIAHDTAKTYWVSDGWNGNICKYDFVMDHGPGYDDHSAGMIWRYTGVPVMRQTGIPGHMVMDKPNKWLYFVDAGNKKIKRLKTTSGTVSGNLFAPNELLASYKSMSGAVVETVDSSSGQPCGIEYYKDRLLVSDYATGDIRVYNTNVPGTPTLMGTINTGQSGIMGIKIGPDGLLWFVNRTANTVVRIDVSPISNDAEISTILFPEGVPFKKNFYSPSFNFCGNALTPVIELRNAGSAMLTSVSIHASIDGGAATSFNWTGSLAPGGVTSVTLSAMVLAAGEHELAIYTSSPNSTSDDNTANDRKDIAFRSRNVVSGLPYIEDFENTAFPTGEWSVIGFNKFVKMSRHNSVSAYGMGSGSLMMDNTGGGVDITGQNDYFLSPRIDLTQSGIGTMIEFEVAHAPYSSTSSDRLQVLVSDDCGSSWNTIYNKAGNTLTTAPAQATSFVPDPWEWRWDTASLDNFIGKEILVLFKFTSNYGNDVFIDNIKIQGASAIGLKETGNAAVNIYPNPSNGETMVETTDAIENIQVTDMLGRQIPGAAYFVTDKKVRLTLTGLSPGSYIVKVSGRSFTANKRIVVQH